jgi:sorbose reductase
VDQEWKSKSHLDNFSLRGKIAVVTGAGQGIGEAAAHALADAGAEVCVVGRSISKLESVVADLSKKTTASFFSGDISLEDDVMALVDYVKSKHGDADILVNNAGIGHWKSAFDISLDEWHNMIDTNLTSAFLLSREFARGMVEKKYGKIVNISSISGLIVNSQHNHAHYGTSKAGLIHLTRSLAAEWAPHGIRVNCITPGYTATEMLQDLLATPAGIEIGKKIKELTPMSEFAEVTDISNGVLYFASPASDFITGQILSIDGGYTLW